MEQLRKIWDALVGAASVLNISASKVATTAALSTAIGVTTYYLKHSQSEHTDTAAESELSSSSSANSASRNPAGKNVNYNQLLEKGRQRQDRLLNKNGNSDVYYQENNNTANGSNNYRSPDSSESFSGSAGSVETTGASKAKSSQAKNGKSTSEGSLTEKDKNQEGAAPVNGSTGAGAPPPSGTSSSPVTSTPETPLFMTSTPAAEITAGECQSIQVNFINSKDNGTVTTKNEKVKVTHSTQGKFYQDATCTTEITEGLAVPSKSESFFIYYKNLKAETMTATVSTTRGFIPEIQITSEVIPAEVHHLIVTGPQEFKTGACVGPFSVKQYDIYDNQGPARSLKNYTLTGLGSATAYSNASCATASSNYSTTGTDTSFDFYLKTNLSESLTLQADDAGAIIAGTLAVKGGPSKLNLTVADPVRSGDCIPVTVYLTDELANPANSFSNLSFSLANSDNYKYYDVSDSTCSGSEISSISFSRNDQTKTVYLKPTGYGATTLSTSDATATMSSATKVTHVSPRSLAWVHTNVTTADTCIVMSVKSTDSLGNAAPVLAAQTINLSNNPTNAKYYDIADTSCAGPATLSSITIASGASSASFHFKDSTAETVTLTATDAASSMITGTSSIIVGPSGLSIATVSPIRSGDCTKYTVSSLDGQGNPKIVLSNINLTFTDGSGSGSFFAGTDNTCSTPVTSTTLLNGTSSVDFYYKDDVAETVTLNADDVAGNLSSGVTTVDVGPRHLILADPGTTLSGNCIATNFKFKDMAGNYTATTTTETVNLSDSTAEGQFYSDAACTTVKTSYAVASGTSTVNYYYKNQKQQTSTITAAENTSKLTSDTTVVSLGPYKLVASANTDTRAGDCELFTVTTKDPLNNVGGVLVATNLSLSDGAYLGQFYAAADTTCSGAAAEPSSAAMAIGDSSFTFRYKNNTASNATITITDLATPNLQTVSPSIKVGPRMITVSSTSQIVAASCTAVVITMKDNATNTAAVIRNTTVNLRDKIFASGSPGTDANGSYFSDAACTTGITSISFAQPTDSTKTVYYKNTKSEKITHDFTDNATWLDPGSYDSEIGPSAITVARQAGALYADPIRAGKCIGYTVTLKDADGNVSAVLPSTTLALKATATGSTALYSDATCTTTLSGGSLSIAAGNSTIDFYIKDDKAEATTLQVFDGAAYNASGMVDAQLVQTIGPSQLKFTTVANNYITGSCQTYVVSTQDNQGTPQAANPLQSVTVNLTQTGTGLFYSDSGCTTQTTTATIGTAANSATLYYKAENVETFTMTAADNNAGWLSSGTSTTIQTWPRTIAITKDVAITATTPLRAGTCHAYTVTLYDSSTVPDVAAVPAAKTINVTTTAASSAKFSTAADCSGATASLALNFVAGNSAKQFYMIDDKGENINIQAVDTGSPDMVDDTVEATSIGPRKLKFTTIANNFITGNCQTYVITTQDNQGTPAATNPLQAVTVNLSTSGTGVYYSDSGCTAAITQTSIGTATSAATVYFKSENVETATLTAADNNANWLTSDTTTTIQSWPRTIDISKDVAITATTPIRAGTCHAYTVSMYDASAVPDLAPVPATKTVAVTTTLATSATFSTAADCSGGTATLNLIFAPGNSSKKFYMKDLKGEDIVIKATDPVASPDMVDDLSEPANIGPNRLSFTLAPTNMRSGLAGEGSPSCQKFTVTTWDAQGTPAATKVLVNTDVTLTGISNGAVYSEATCTTPLASNKIHFTNATSASQDFYYANPVREAVTLTATDDNASWLTATSTAVNIWPKTINLTLDPGSAGLDNNYTPLRAGKCLQLDLVLRDANGTPADVFASAPTATITLAAKNGATPVGTFYSDAACTTALSQPLSYASGGSVSTKYYYKNDTAQSVDFSSTNSFTGLTAGLVDVAATKSIGPNKFAITSGRPSISINECRRYTVAAKDVNNTNAAIVSATAPDTNKTTVAMYYVYDASAVDGTHNANDGFFYSDSSCSTQFPVGTSGYQEGTMAVGAATLNVYFKKASKDLVTLYFKEPIDYYVSTSKVVEVGSEKLEIRNNATITGTAADVEYPVGSGTFYRYGGLSTIRSGDCQRYTLASLDSANNLLPVLVNTTFTINDQATGSGQFYSAADCTGPISNVTLLAGATSKDVYYKDLKGEVLTFAPPTMDGLKVDDGAGGRDAGMLSMIIGPAQLGLPVSSSADKISVDKCVLYNVTALDLQGTPAAPSNGVNQNTTFSITDGAGSGAFYTDAACTIQATTPSAESPEFTMIAGGATKSVYPIYYKNTTVENVTFTITDLQPDPTLVLAGSTFAVEVGADTFKLVSSTTPSGKIRTGACGPFVIETWNSTAVPAKQAVLNDSLVNLGGVGAGAFYSDAACTSVITSVTMLTGTDTSSTIYYKNNVAGSVTLAANDPTATPGRVAASFPLTTLSSQLVWPTTPTAMYGAECAAFTLTAMDKQGTPVAGNVERATTLSLDDAAGSGTFYSDSSCTPGNEITTVAMASGASITGTFYYKNTVDSGPITLSASDSTNYLTDNLGALTTGTHGLTMGAQKLKILATNPEIRSGDCGSYLVASKASDGTTAVNTFATETVTLSVGGGSGALYSDAACTTLLPLSQVTISSGNSQSNQFYFKSNVAESVSVTATHTTAKMAPDTVSFVTKERKIITALNSGGNVLPQSACALLDVQIKDFANSATAVTALRTLNLSSNSGSGSFYAAADTTCSGASTTTMTIANAASSGQVRFKNTGTGSVTITVADSAAAPLTMDSGTLTVTIGPNVLFFTAADGSTSTNLNDIAENECGLFKVSVATSASPTTETNAISNININLSISGGGGLFYADNDATCAGASSATKSVTILNTTPSVYFRYKNAVQETVTLNADDQNGWMTSGMKAVNIIPPCSITSLKVEPILAAVPNYNLTTADKFNLKITALDADGTTVKTCYRGVKNYTFTTNATSAGSFACTETSATPTLPSETTLTFNNGTATTTSSVAQLKVPETVTITADDGTKSGTTNPITVTAGAICQIKLKDAASGGGSLIPQAPGLNLNVDDTSSTVYAIGMDAFGNYVNNVSVIWSGTGVVKPWGLTNILADDSAKVVGVKIGTGTLRADYAGGGGDKTAVVNVTVNAVNNIATWNNVTTDYKTNSLLSGTTILASYYWKASSDTDTSWLSTGAQTWRGEAQVQNIRSSRANFPDQAYLIGTNNGLDIIDATTNVLWMRFQRDAGKAIDSNLGDISAISAIDGKIFVGMTNGTQGGLIIIDLANDSIKMLDTSGLFTLGNLSVRNTVGSWGLVDASKTLVHKVINDLKVARSGAYDVIAVATNGGGSVLQYNGATLNTSKITTTNVVSATAVDTNAKVYFAELNTGIHRCDLSLPAGATVTASRTYSHANSVYLPSLAINDISLAQGTSTAQASQNTLFIAHDLGMSTINEHSTAASSTSFVSHVKGSSLPSGLGNNLLLNGVDSYGTFGFGALTGPVTIEMWFNPASTINSGSGSVTLYERGTGNGSLKVYFAGGNLNFTFTDSVGTVITTQSTATTWTKGQWHHFAGVVTASGVEQWIDGADHKTNATVPASLTIASANSFVGANSSAAQFFGGALEELRLSSVARHSGASFAVQSAPFTSDGSTVSLFAFESRTGTTITKAAGSYDMTAAGKATLSTARYSGTDYPVLKVISKVISAQVNIAAVNSYGYTEANNAQNTTPSYASSAAFANIDSLFFFNEDSATDLDIGICTPSSGMTLYRR